MKTLRTWTWRGFAANTASNHNLMYRNLVGRWADDEQSHMVYP